MVSIWTKAAAEFAGSWWALTFGNSLVANAALRRTKGSGMSFGFVGLFYGLCFFFPIFCFDNISAALNPAVMLANLVLGRATVAEFFLFSVMEIIGCFCGGVTCWLINMGHFNLKVTPPLPSGRVTLCSSRLQPSPFPSRGVTDSTTSVAYEAPKEEGGARVTDLPFVALNAHGRMDGRLLNEGDELKKTILLYRPHRHQNMTDSDLLLHLQDQHPTVPQEEWDYISQLYASQAAKLSVFSTRPEIYNWWQNLLTEALGTMFLVWGANSAGDVSELLDNAEFSLLYRRLLFAFFLATYIGLCVTALGGPTGYAANPARDLGPRLAHWVLPIPEKGPSEWEYSWVPIVGPLLGALLGAGLYESTRHMMVQG